MLSGQNILLQAKTAQVAGNILSRGDLVIDAQQQRLAGQHSSQMGNISLRGKDILVAGSLKSDQGSISAQGSDSGRSESIRTTAQGTLSAAKQLHLSSEAMQLDGDHQGQMGVVLDWKNYNSSQLNGQLKSDQWVSLQGNVDSASTLEFATGKSDQIQASGIGVHTTHAIEIDQSIAVDHGMSITAPSLKLKEQKQITSNHGSIALDAYAGSIEMDAGSGLHANKQVLLRSAGDIRTKAVHVNGASIALEAKGNVVDEAQVIETHIVTEAFGVKEEHSQTKPQVSQFDASGNISMKGHNIVLHGTQVDGGSIHLEAQDKLAILAVEETSSTTRRTEKDITFGDLKISPIKIVDTQSDSRTQFVGAQLKAKNQVVLQSAGDIHTQAVTVKGASIFLEAKGNIKDEARFTDTHAQREAPGLEEKSSQRKAQVSQLDASGHISMKGQNVFLQGTRADGGTIEVEAQDQLAIMGVREGSSMSRRTEKDRGCLFWAGKEVETQSESSTDFLGARLKAKKTTSMKAKEVTLEAPELDAPETTIDAEKVKWLLGKKSYQQKKSKKSENAFWVTADSLEEQHDTFVQAKIKGKVKVNAQRMEFQQVQGQVLDYIEHLEFDRDKVEVVTHLLEEFHHRKEESISAPGPALIAVVAIAASIATGGVGGVAAAGMSLKAASLAGAMTSAAISSLTAKVATQLVLGILAQQSPGDIFTKTFSAETLKGMITSAVTAGTLYEVQGAQETAEISDFLRRVENAGAQSGVSMGARLAFGEQNLEDALKSAGVQFVSQTGSGYVADRIGTHFAHQKDPLDRAIHKLAHGGSAAGFAALGAAALNQDVGAAAAGAATGAMISEIVAETLRGPLTDDLQAEKHKQEAKLGRPLTKDEGKIIFDSKKADISNLARLTGALSGLLTGSATGVASAQGGAQTALANNFEVTLDKQWGEIWANLNTPPEESGQQKPLSFDYRELAENGVAPLGESAPMTEFDTDQVQAARQAEIEKGFKNGTIQVKLGADGNVTVQTDPRTLPHLAPNLHRVPNHRTDLPVEEDPVPEMILGGGIQIGVHRAVKGACFPGETAICLSDNQSTPIESIREGDFVESYNMASQARECRRVERIFHHVADHLLILTIGEKTLRATDNHPFYLPAVNRWVEAQSLQKGDELQTLDGDTVRVDEIRGEDGKFPVFNFEVESTHTYYAEGVLVHNCGGAHAVQEMGAAYSEARVFDSAGHGLVKLEQASIKTPQGLNNFSKNPLKEVKYTNRVEGQVKRGDFHGFPDEVDNFAGLGKRSTITGGDGIPRTKIELEGGYMNRDGHFEWIIEPDGVTVNHRLFVPKK